MTKSPPYVLMIPFLIAACVADEDVELDTHDQAVTSVLAQGEGRYCVKENRLPRLGAVANYGNLEAAIADAGTSFAAVRAIIARGDTLRAGYHCPAGTTAFRYRIKFPGGDFAIDPGGVEKGVAGMRADPAIRLRGTDLDTSADRELVLQGAGRDSTRLRIPFDVRWIHGAQVSHVTMRDLTLRHDTDATYKVSQGQLAAIGKTASYHFIDLDIDAGFPRPSDLDQDLGKCLDPNAACDGQKWLRRYAIAQAGEPRMITVGNDQVAWLGSDVRPRPGTGDTYRMYLNAPLAGPHPYAGHANARIAIKSKHGAMDAYRFVGGSDITFLDVRMINETRGFFDHVERVRIENLLAEPLTDNAILASSGGGPQISGGTGHVATGNRLFHLGDDAIAFHNSVRTSSATNNVITDNFARGIYIEGTSSAVTRSGNTLVRNYPNELVVPDLD